MDSQGSGNKERKQYSKRIRHLRRLILITVAAACLIPTCICVILAVRYDRLNGDYKQAVADLQWYRDKYGTEMEILSDAGSDEAVDMSFDETGEVAAEESSGAEETGVDYATIGVSGAQNQEDIEGTK
jgi:hypothetical protein